MLLNQFLRAVLPDEGIKCWTSIKEKKAVNHFCNTFDELSAQILDSDAAGVDTYHACATFKTAQNRRAANAAWMKSFWADIDVGEGKPYATIEAAIQACDAFCDRAAIPIPGLVASGTGLHAYWVQDVVLPSGEWFYIAQRLKLLMQATGFNLDPASIAQTADAARILRSPETKNYKIPAAPRPVHILDPDLFAPISYADFSASVIKNTDGLSIANVNTPLKTTGANAAFSAGIASKAFDATLGVAAGSRGSTQLKYAGELVAKGHPYEDVVARCVEWNKRCTPPQEEAEVIRVVKSAFNMHAQKHPEVAITRSAAVLTPLISPSVNENPMAEVLPPCPWGYRWGNANQLQVEVIVGKDEEDQPIKEWKTVTQMPAYMEAWLNEEWHAQKNAYLFRLFHPVRGWHSFSMGTKDFNGDKWYGEWTQNGGSVTDGMDKAFKTYVRRAENMLRIPGLEKTQYSQFGWKDTAAGPNTAFLVGNKLCHADGHVENAVGTDKLTPLMQSMIPARTGSLEKWSMAANKLGAPGLEAHLFMVVASFAATLMKFCVDEGNGGSILSIVSDESGYGKTPMATGMASVWGTLGSIRSTGNFTGNRLIDDVVRRCNLPQVQEEMPYSDPAIAAEGVKKFTSGSDRGRLDQGGNAKGIPEVYQTLIISISNKSPYQLVKMVDGPMACRIFEIEIERPDKELLANIGGIAREMMANCGHAGLQWARFIVNPQMREYISGHLRGSNMGSVGSTQLRYREFLNSSPEHRYIVWPLACIDVAAQILNHYKIMEFDINRLMNWAVNQAKLYTKTEEMDVAAMKLDAFIRDNINTCITVQGPYSPKTGPQLERRSPSGNKLYMRMEITTNRLYIATEPLKEWCAKHGISLIGLGKKLRADGVVLNTSRPMTLGAGTNIVSARCLCWEVDTGHPQMSSQMREELAAPEEGNVLPLKA